MKAEVLTADPSQEYLTPEGCYILKYPNEEADEDASIARARVPPGVTTQWHRLDGIEERYVILSGRGRVEVTGLAPADVGPGDVVRIPAYAAQRIANTGAADLVFYCVCTPRFRQEKYEVCEP